MFNDLPQIYGTQYTFENEINVLYPVKDIHAVDAMRKSVGLGPLKKYMEENNIVLESGK